MAFVVQEMVPMKRLQYLRGQRVLLLLLLMVVVAGILANWRTELEAFNPITPKVFVSDAFKHSVTAYPPPSENPSTSISSHNFRRPNKLITEYDNDVKMRLASLVERKATATDPGLIRLIRDMLDPPSDHMLKVPGYIYHTSQSREVESILKKKVKTA